MSNLALGTAARPGNLRSRLGKALLKTSPFPNSLESLENYLSQLSRVSLSDPNPPLGAAAPLGVSLGGYKSNPAQVLLPARGSSVTMSRLSCQRVLTYAWASEYFRKGRRTAADEAAVQPERTHFRWKACRPKYAEVRDA